LRPSAAEPAANDRFDSTEPLTVLRRLSNEEVPVSVPALVGGSVATHAARDTGTTELLACYQEHNGALVGYLVTLVGDVALAQDIAQEAFVDLFARWRTVRHPRAYVYTSATNLARSYWRRRGREARALASVDRISPTTVEAYDPWLCDLVNRLPKGLRMPVLLHYYADLPVAEVAEQLHLPVGTVKRRLHEARAQLLAVLEAPSA
jgi:RNA polymerase sigma-70 factor (ECF subfamily)